MKVSGAVEALGCTRNAITALMPASKAREFETGAAGKHRKAGNRKAGLDKKVVNVNGKYVTGVNSGGLGYGCWLTKERQRVYVCLCGVSLALVSTSSIVVPHEEECMIRCRRAIADAGRSVCETRWCSLAPDQAFLLAAPSIEEHADHRQRPLGPLRQCLYKDAHGSYQLPATASIVCLALRLKALWNLPSCIPTTTLPECALLRIYTLLSPLRRQDRPSKPPNHQTT